jgi:tetratricopeptide (TPR) repeat protein
MRKKWQFQCIFLSIFLLLSFTSVLYAKTADEYVDEAYKLIDQKQYDEALALVRKGVEEYPGDLGLTIAGTEIQHLKGNYEIAIANYINIMRAIRSTGKETPSLAHYHYNLVDAYNELGQKHYFSKELCLRIIYHVEKTFELEPKASQDPKLIDFLRKSIGHYDVASMGTGNVKMMETGGDGADFQLPDDYVSDDEKIRYKDKAIQRIKEYDAMQKESAFRTVASDKTVEDIIQLVNQRASAIRTIHFKRINTANGANALLEEITYKSPDRIKVVEPDTISVISNKDYYVLDPQTKKVIQQDRLDPAKVSLLKGIGFYNLQETLEAYNLTIEKIATCPDFLSEICRNTYVDLYLITGRLKDKDKGPYPPTPKVEYFIDGQTGLCLAKREYWLGVLGSGKEEELAKETIVTKIEKRPAGISVPSAGKTKGYVEELANLKEDWTIEVLSINQEIGDQEFSVSK